MPVGFLCLTRRNGWWKEIPYKSPNKARKIEEKTVFIIEYQDKVAIRKRPMNGLLAGLYEFPNACGHPDADAIPSVLGMAPLWIKSITPLPAAKHVFSHVEWHMTGYRVVLDEAAADPLFPGGREEGKARQMKPRTRAGSLFPGNCWLPPMPFPTHFRPIRHWLDKFVKIGYNEKEE